MRSSLMDTSEADETSYKAHHYLIKFTDWPSAVHRYSQVMNNTYKLMACDITVGDPVLLGFSPFQGRMVTARVVAVVVDMDIMHVVQEGSPLRLHP